MEMDAERVHDLLASLIEFCKPSASQEAQFPNCLFAPETENFGDSNRDQLSPSPSPSQAPVIFMVSPPGSLSSGDNEEGAVYLTPPEHHSHSQLSSSEDQNPNELRAEADRTAKRVRTEVVESEGVDDTEVIVLDSGDSKGEERAASVPAQGRGGDELGEKDSGDSNGEERAASVPAQGRGGDELGEKDSGDSNGEERAASVPAQGRDGDELGEKVKEIEEFRYAGDVNRRCEVERRRRLPPSLKGKGKEKDVVESSEKKSALFGLLDVLEVVFGDADSGSKDVDFLETAKRRGMAFPKPRWWGSN